ncbi:MAG: molybdopterin oxidoreductase family protein [Alphaproteobacteria bacterium]|nr:molybdopterin oxidoreductase family protein [Alphaproteobacteria bacterium]
MPGEHVPSVCPHDCPGACSLDVERLGPDRIGRVRGAATHPYTAGVVCAKVARYAERVHHPDRLRTPLRRIGPKGSGRFAPIGWDEALGLVADAFREAAGRHGAETVWPYFYGGTMGQIQRAAVNRLRHVMGYSRMAGTICASIAGAGLMAGFGVKMGSDPREMAESDLIVLWGMNPVATQVNVMTHVARARKERKARLVVVDPYRSASAEAADLHVCPRPGTDGALACAMMHVLFRDGLADRDFLARRTEGADELERHLDSRTPAWAAAITGLGEEEITSFAHAYGAGKRSFLRLGYGMSRSRNGAVNVHAVSCLPMVTGAWEARGGGALLSTSGLFRLQNFVAEALDSFSPSIRELDMCQIGRVLTGDVAALKGGPPVTAMLVQNANPAATAPESMLVREGFLREDLFLCVHEQFMTDTARMADVVLPATTFLEHDDLYTSYGHTFMQVARPVIPPVGEARCNHDVVDGLARALGINHPSFEMTPWEMIDRTLVHSGYPGADRLLAMGWLDCARSFEEMHFLDTPGRAAPRFRFAPDWANGDMPRLPDHWAVTEDTDGEHPFRMVTAPARQFLNSTFTETPTSRGAEGRPTVLVHPEDGAALGLTDGAPVVVGNRRGSVTVRARMFAGLRRGVVVVESVWPGRDFPEGVGINALTGADPAAPAGGAAFHDTAVWIRKTP